MHRAQILAVGLLGAGLALAAQAAGNPLAPDERPTRTARAQNGQALSLPSTAAPAAIVSEYLRRSGHDDATVGSLKVERESRGRSGDRLHVRMSQEVAGLRVYDAYLKASLNGRGELVSVIENLAPGARGGVARAEIDAAAAVGAALRALGIGAGVPAVSGRQGETTSFARGGGFLEDTTATRVAIPMSDGSLAAGYVVITWRSSGNQLDETLVAGNGRVVDSFSRTNTDSYNVFTVDPNTTAQSVEPGGTGWLFGGDHSTVDIAGNNVNAYLDTDNDNASDGGGTTVSDGNFLSVFNPAVQPSDATNQNVAVQNLFYVNNVIHDRLHAAGFDEAAGNFQEDNFGNGGRGGDSVNAEAQDGGSLDNANFATPGDGRNPRMQMYLWSSPDPDYELVIDAPGSIAGTYLARGAVWGGTLDATGVTDDIVYASDGVAGGTVNDGCEALTTDVSSKIAMVDRGFCNFTVKAKNAQNAGAVGVIIVQNVADAPFLMGGEDATVTIPGIMISQADGATIKAETGVHGTMALRDPAPIMLDGDLDSDIIWHEYGHGLTWRMIGRMNGPLAGAIGEGMSDVLAIVVNDDDLLGEYSAPPAGIRAAPYDTWNEFTYGDIVPTEVHFDGELYGAIGWRLWENYQAEGLSADDLLGDLVDGMNFTGAHPEFEEMRDGILASVAGNTVRECAVWDAFAHFGVGEGASGTTRGSNMVITESFTTPCP